MQMLSMLALILISSYDQLPSFRITYTPEGMPVIGSPFVLKVTVEALVPTESTETCFHAQEGVEILTGDLRWKGYLETGDRMVLTYTILVQDTGKYNVWTTVIADGRALPFGYSNSELSNYYLWFRESETYLGDTIPAGFVKTSVDTLFAQPPPEILAEYKTLIGCIKYEEPLHTLPIP